jgi:hypothetical protein
MVTRTKNARSELAEESAISLLTADHRRVARLFAEFSSLQDGAPDMRKAGIVRQICRELIVHTLLEDEFFYPAVRGAIDDDDLMDEALVEHAGAKDLIAQLQAAAPADDLYHARVTVLGEQIDHHVMEEEGNMFSRAKAAGVDTSSLAAAMRARKAQLWGNDPPTTLAVNASATHARTATIAPGKKASKKKR